MGGLLLWLSYSTYMYKLTFWREIIWLLFIQYRLTLSLEILQCHQCHLLNSWQDQGIHCRYVMEEEDITTMVVLWDTSPIVVPSVWSFSTLNMVLICQLWPILQQTGQQQCVPNNERDTNDEYFISNKKITDGRYTRGSKTGSDKEEIKENDGDYGKTPGGKCWAKKPRC